MRVLTLIDGLGFGGAEMLLADFAAGAPSAGVELEVAYLFEKDGSPAAPRLRARGVEPVHVPVTGLVKPSAVRAVRAHIRAVQPDVVHTHLGYSDFLGGVAARSLGVPAVSTIHIMAWDPALRPQVKLRLMDQAQKRCMTRTICVSDAARAAYLEQGWGAPDRVVTVHNGIEGRPAAQGAAAGVRAELGLAPDDVVVTMLSVLRPGKGHEAAFAAVEHLGERVRLVVAGTGPSEAELRELAAPLGDRVVFAGHRDDVMALLEASDVLLHPSHVDAFPTALLEAMAAGRPVVATAVGGIPEIVDDGVTGTLIGAPPAPEQLAAALGALTGDDAARARMGAAGRARFDEHFTAAAWAARVRAVYDLAVHRNSSA